MASADYGSTNADTLDLFYTYTITGCNVLSTAEAIRATAYVPDGDPYCALFVTLRSSESYGVSTATFKFTSLFMTMLTDGIFWVPQVIGETGTDGGKYLAMCIATKRLIYGGVYLVYLPSTYVYAFKFSRSFMF
jgi:hypothetical protein